MFLTTAQTIFNDVPGSKTHMNGLEEIIRRRGGVGTLDSNPAMRMVFILVRKINFVKKRLPQD
jgi:hypothetical protein